MLFNIKKFFFIFVQFAARSTGGAGAIAFLIGLYLYFFKIIFS